MQHSPVTSAPKHFPCVKGQMAGGYMNGTKPRFWHSSGTPNARASLGLLLGAACAAATLPDSASAADPVILPAPPFELPFIPSLADNWTVRFGAGASVSPSYLGSKTYQLSPTPILSIHKAGAPEGFSGAQDSPSITLFDFGRFQAGPVANFDMGRKVSSDKALKGLNDIDPTFEAGAFAQFYLEDWLRTRLEVRQQFGGTHGVVGDFSADAVLPLTDRLTVSAGPRVSVKSQKAVSPYFDVSSSQAVASGLSEYHPKGATESVGLGAEVTYKFTQQWEIHSSVEYGRLFGSAAKSSLVKQRGSPDQLTFGIGISYSFDANVR